MYKRRVTHPRPGRGRLRWALAGHAVRLLPDAVLRSAARRGPQGSTAKVPPFADFVRFLEAAGPAAGIVMGELDPTAPVSRSPELDAVTVRPLKLGPQQVRARLYSAADLSDRAALVWISGGAFVAGSLDMPESDWVARTLAARGTPVLALDYRKALNGLRHPAPSDDVLTGWHWAVEHSAESLGVPPERLHLGGASAGGNLAAAATRRLLDTDGPLPASLLLAYPVVHGRLPEWDPLALAAVREVTHGACLPLDWIADMCVNYAGPDHLLDPHAFPGEATPPENHPPTLILACENDTLRTSAERFAGQLEAAGITTVLHQLDGAAHRSLDRPTEPDGQQALNHLATWLARE
ncbi:alpha/beta hydrolase fold domain-containing protein [Streptomyces sp. NPDC087263]|uniref:alpha/beta hydrolase fold domain-containing protein n=1 Tax=Streptomyces sp. NPDC087263 TaxID=3365773 RepID=UPI00380B6D20